MKISKLFHWLYAILMLLPILIFVPNSFYYGFNEHAVAQEKTEQVPVYYETNNVTQLSDLVVGNVYRLTYQPNIATVSYQITFSKYWVIHEGQISQDYAQRFDELPYIRITPSYYYLPLYVNPDNENQVFRNMGNELTIDFVLRDNNIPSVDFISQCPIQYVSEYQPLTTNMSITDSMSYAWDSVWQNDLFSWSYGSFLTEPFIYIGNVFNVPVDNSLYYALSYWLDISIIWLCFDLVMYIPLLVHRWLDKGIIE